MLFENLSFGLDIATALSVIAAAIAFLWNSINSNKRNREERLQEREKERIERRKEIVMNQVFNVVDKIIEEKRYLKVEVEKIATEVEEKAPGEKTQNLNPYRDLIISFVDIFKNRLIPIGKVYGNGMFHELVTKYEEELYEFIQYLAHLTKGESNKEWDFYAVMYKKPIAITDKYVMRMLSESEKYLDSL